MVRRIRNCVRIRRTILFFHQRGRMSAQLTGEGEKRRSSAIGSASPSSRRFPGTYGRSDLGIAPYAWETPPRLIFGHLPLKGKAYDGRFVKRHYGGKPRAVEDAGPYRETRDLIRPSVSTGAPSPCAGKAFAGLTPSRCGSRWCCRSRRWCCRRS